MGVTRELLAVGPLSVEVPAVAGARLLRSGRFAAWSSEDLVVVSVGCYSAAVDERGTVVLRKY